MKMLRIKNDSGLGKDTQVFFTDDNGDEVEISNMLKNVTISMPAEDVNQATVQITTFAKLDILAEMIDVDLDKLLMERIESLIREWKHGR